MTKKAGITLGILGLILLLAVACGPAATPTPTPTDTPRVTPTPTPTTGASPTPGGTTPAPGTMTPAPGGTTPAPSGGDPARGQQVAQQNGCLGCHTIDGTTSVGPTWRGLFGKTETLQDGSTVKVDEAYLAESIKNPNAKVVQGFPAVMPALPLSDQDIQDVIAYIKTLQ